MKRIRETATAALLAVIAVPAATHAARPHEAPFHRVVAFGDSLSDAGNRYILTGEQTRAPYQPIASEPYAIGGHRFTNGATWIELLARALNDPLGGKPSLQRNRSNSNYAFGGARARPGGQWPDLTTQVLAYLDDHGAADPDALHVVWIGANDVRDSLALLQAGDVPAAVNVVSTAVQTIVGSVFALYNSGARSFLIANVPDIGILPAVRSGNDPVAIGAASLMSATFNQGLDLGLGALDALPGIRTIRFDVAALLSDTYANPMAYGLADSSSPCLSFLVIENAICSNPDAHLFWDAAHPTKQAHRILADSAFGLLTSP